MPWLLGWPLPAPRTTFAAGLHAGSCAGIAVALLADRPPARTLALAASTCLPAAVAGLLAADAVEQRLGRPAQLAALMRAPENLPMLGNNARLAQPADDLLLAEATARLWAARLGAVRRDVPAHA